MARIVLVFATLCLAGCGTGARDEAVANQAASVFEAGLALERGADPAKVAAAVKASGAAIIHAVGYTYQPAVDLIQALSAPKGTP